MNNPCYEGTKRVQWLIMSKDRALYDMAVAAQSLRESVAKLIDIAESMGTDELTIARMRKDLEDTPSTLKLLKN